MEIMNHASVAGMQLCLTGVGIADRKLRDMGHVPDILHIHRNEMARFGRYDFLNEMILPYILAERFGLFLHQLDDEYSKYEWILSNNEQTIGIGAKLFAGGVTESIDKEGETPLNDA